MIILIFKALISCIYYRGKKYRKQRNLEDLHEKGLLPSKACTAKSNYPPILFLLKKKKVKIVLLMFSLLSSPESMDNKKLTVTDFLLSLGNHFLFGELIFSSNSDDTWQKL